MIAEELALEQIARFGVLPKFPTEPIAFTELMNTLREVARTPEHASAIVTRLVRTSSYCPLPMHIVQAADEVAVEGVTPAHRDSDCRECQGSGYALGTYLVTWEVRGMRRISKKQRISRSQAETLRPKIKGFPVQEIYEAATYCGCEYGERLRTLRTAVGE